MKTSQLILQFFMLIQVIKMKASMHKSHILSAQLQLMCSVCSLLIQIMEKLKQKVMWILRKQNIMIFLYKLKMGVALLPMPKS
ncbi:hypothetical protein XENTR_v10008085 [Xenopus tropicalis]|nr:hypothetical protein XENTR_v10008085 [Xenopus tropicalis]